LKTTRLEVVPEKTKIIHRRPGAVTDSFEEGKREIGKKGQPRNYVGGWTILDGGGKSRKGANVTIRSHSCWLSPLNSWCEALFGGLRSLAKKQRSREATEGEKGFDIGASNGYGFHARKSWEGGTLPKGVVGRFAFAKFPPLVHRTRKKNRKWGNTPLGPLISQY